jgi:hypothetical protein
MIEGLIIVAITAYVFIHAMHSHRNYRHGRRRGHRGIGFWWYVGRGPYVSIPGPFNWRFTHKI